MRIQTFVLFVLPVLASCAGAGSSPATLPAAVMSDAARRQPSSVTPGTNLLYVGNVGNGSITVYRSDAQGNTAPLAVIAGPKTQIGVPGQLSEDAAGNLYVANNVAIPFGNAFTGTPSPVGPSILVFAHGANGNVAPIRTIVGPRTTFRYELGGVTVDQATGKIFAVDTNIPFDGSNAVQLRFPANANGNASPYASGTIQWFALQLASDSTGRNLIEAHIDAFGCCASALGVDTYTKQFADNTSPAGISSIQGISVSGVADDPATKTYVVSTSSGISRYAENVNGPALSTITSAPYDCRQLALGDQRSIYATCGRTVNVYPHDASGNAAPLRVLGGSATKLNEPYGIYEGT